ncbi:MAG: S28 family serine protease [Bacteriovoracia bacterium]
MLKNLLLLLCLLGGSQNSRADSLPDEDVLAQLNSLPGVEATEKTTRDDAAKNVRRFSATIEQPVDHFNPKSAKFRQKLVIFHRGYKEPMVLQTSGYIIFGERLSRLASVFGTNQIQVEHRYFGESTPVPTDWSKLTVRQSAEDFHHIAETFKSTYSARWVNTGASKGGMTSVFHRRFYPNDLAGTVADVAPFSYALDDDRYVAFVDAVGGATYADCRERLYDLQQALLRRSEEILPEIEGSYEKLGDKLIAYESAVVEMPFVFWQYGDPTNAQWGCGALPAASASAHTLANFLKVANNPNSSADAGLEIFQPYFFQAAAELGGPGAKLSHLRGLLKYPYVLDPFLPKGVRTPYSNGVLLDMRGWAAESANKLLFIYGEFDPWTAGSFPRLQTGEKADNHQFVVPRGNHSANFMMLPGTQRSEAIATLSRWLNKAPVASETSLQAFGPTAVDDSLEALELRALRSYRPR